MGFDGRFEQGRSFHYGALSIGGMGAARYGNFCMVTSELLLDGSRRVAFVESDSLTGFVDAKGVVDMESLRVALAAPGHQQHLAACKHAGDCDRLASEAWQEILCCDDDYVEAIFLGLAGLEDLALVRFPQADYYEIQDLVLAEAAGDSLSDAERLLINRFAELKETSRRSRRRSTWS